MSHTRDDWSAIDGVVAAWQCLDGEVTDGGRTFRFTIMTTGHHYRWFGSPALRSAGVRVGGMDRQVYFVDEPGPIALVVGDSFDAHDVDSLLRADPLVRARFLVPVLMPDEVDAFADVVDIGDLEAEPDR